MAMLCLWLCLREEERFFFGHSQSLFPPFTEMSVRIAGAASIKASSIDGGRRNCKLQQASVSSRRQGGAQVGRADDGRCCGAESEQSRCYGTAKGCRLGWRGR